MKYFVTGATGFVGGALAGKLREMGHEVHAVVRNPDRAGKLPSLGVKIFEGDVTDKESLREGMTGTDGVFHVAGWYKIGTRDKSDGERVNIQGTRNVLDLMRELHIPKGVYTSTLAVNSDTNNVAVDENYRFIGRHISEYDRTKAAAHDIASEFIAEGLPLVIVQPGMIYGPGDTSPLRENLVDLLKGRLPAVPSRFLACWAHVEDIVMGHILAMEKGRVGEVYIIAGEPVPFADVFKLAAHISGKRAPMTVPHQLFRVLSVMVKPFDNLLPTTYTSESLRIFSGATYWGDNGKARRELGYDPRPFHEGWEETVRHEMNLLGMS